MFTGVGKSGFIAQKISQTLISTGTKAMYLNPTDALHGDLGIVRKEDLIVLFSKSGNTEELVRLVPYAKVSTAAERNANTKTDLHTNCEDSRHGNQGLDLDTRSWALQPLAATHLFMQCTNGLIDQSGIS